tara:strand:+ start:560 stop:2545 length:1986 start_codon:yes stop_codon:yes gene_type:complete
MSVQIKGSGTISGIDEGLNISGISTFAGNVLIAGTNANANVGADDLVIGTTSGSDSHGITIKSPTNKYGRLYFGDDNSSPAWHRGQIEYNHSNDSLSIYTAADEQLRITSGGSVRIGDAATHTFSAHSEGDDLVVGGSGWRGLTIYGEGGGGVIQFADNGDNRIGQIIYDHGNNQMDFRVNGNQTRLRIGSNGLLTVNATTYEALKITTTENGNNGPEIQLIHNSASPAANDCVGQLRFSGKDSAGNTDLMGRIETIIDSPTSGDESAHLNFAIRGQSAFNTTFRIKRRGTASAPSYTADDIDGIIFDTYNEGGGSSYKRHMSLIAKSAGNTDSNIAFWTESVGGSPTEKLRISSAGKIGIGENNPQRELHLTTAGNCGIRIEGGTSHTCQVLFTPAGGTEHQGRIGYYHGSNTMDFYTSGAERLRIDGSGKILLGTTRTQYANDYYDDITINNSGGSAATGACGITMISDSGSWGAVQFGDDDDDDVGYIKYSHGDNHMRFATGGSIRARLDSDGLKFNNDTAASNGLDDYEEGSFNPAVTGSTSAGTGSNSAIEGYYTKIGNLVHVDVYINQTSHNGTGQVRISVPFSCKAGAQVVGSVMLDSVNFDSNFRTIASHIWGNSDKVALYGTRDDATWDGIGMSGNLDSSVRYIFSITYPVA